MSHVGIAALFAITLLSAPGTVFAVTTPRDFAGVVNFFLGIINLIIPVLFGAALIVFIWGLVDGWVLHGGTEQGQERGKNMAIAGIVGLVVMTGMWGIIALARSFLAF